MKLRRSKGTPGFPTADEQLASLMRNLAAPAPQPVALSMMDQATGPINVGLIAQTGQHAAAPCEGTVPRPPSDFEVQDVLARVNQVQRVIPMPWDPPTAEQLAADRHWLAQRGIELPALPQPVQQAALRVQGTIDTAPRPWDTSVFREVEADHRLLRRYGAPLPELPHRAEHPPPHNGTEGVAPQPVASIAWADRATAAMEDAAAEPDGCPICTADSAHEKPIR